jgi:hypothetical protein
MSLTAKQDDITYTFTGREIVVIIVDKIIADINVPPILLLNEHPDAGFQMHSVLTWSKLYSAVH